MYQYMYDLLRVLVHVLNLLHVFLCTVQLPGTKVLQLLIKFWVQGSIYLHCTRCAITATHLPYFMVCSTHKFQKTRLSQVRHRSEQPLTYGEDRAVLSWITT